MSSCLDPVIAKLAASRTSITDSDRALGACIRSRLREADASSIPSMLDTALAFHMLPASPDGLAGSSLDPRALVRSAGDSVGSAPQCGYIFRNGDIAWVCRTCQTDDTCVLCEECFSSSNHEGHEVFFHRTRAGGCCDCGDLEAWKAEGCCPRHRGGDCACELPAMVSYPPCA